MKFVVISPRQNSGGAIVLHLLCRGLLKLGHDAKVLYLGDCLDKKQGKYYVWTKWLEFMVKDFIKYSLFLISSIFSLNHICMFEDCFYEQVEGCSRKWLPNIDDDTIVVYPDVVYGNILNAKKVVRYLLFYNKFKDDKDAYGTDDLFYCYRQVFNDYDLNPKCRILTLSNFDFKLYKQTNLSKRQGSCYIVRKGQDRNDLPIKFDGPVIDNWSEKEKVAAFNKYKFCYFYDIQTFYTLIASVCGCIPVIAMEPGKTIHDYFGPGEYPIGMACGDSQEEIDRAIKSRKDVLAYLETFEESNLVSINQFVDTCNKYF